MNGGLDYPKGNSYQVLSTSGQPTNSVLSGVESAEARRKPPRVDLSIRYFKGLLHNTLKVEGFEKSLRTAYNLKAAGETTQGTSVQASNDGGPPPQPSLLARSASLDLILPPQPNSYYMSST